MVLTGPIGGEPTEVVISSGSWSSIDPGLFNTIRDRLLEVWADDLGVETSDLPFGKTEMGRILTEYGDAFKATEGAFPTHFAEVRDNPEMWTRIGRHVTGADLLPAVYEMNGSIYENFPDMPSPQVSTNPLRSIAKSVTPNLLQRTGVSQAAISAFWDDIDIDNLEGFDGGEVEGQRIGPDPSTATSTGKERTGSITADAFKGLEGDVDERFRGLVGRGLLNLAQNRIPQISQQEHERAATFQQDEKPGSGRGSLTFDKTALRDGANSLWGKVLWENAPGGVVDKYIASANQIYRASGVQQSYEAFLMAEMRQSQKYGVMYGRMEPGFTELEWQRRFDTSSFGLRVEDERAQSIRGMSSGAAPASFQQSVENSRDVEMLGQGRFSRRFANSIAQLGPLQKR